MFLLKHNYYIYFYYLGRKGKNTSVKGAPVTRLTTRGRCCNKNAASVQKTFDWLALLSVIFFISQSFKELFQARADSGRVAKEQKRLPWKPPALASGAFLAG